VCYLVMGVLKHGVGWRLRLHRPVIPLYEHLGIIHVTTSEENSGGQECLVKVLLAATVGLCKVASTALPSICNCLPIVHIFLGRGNMEW
jgi:hypothetical protein